MTEINDTAIRASIRSTLTQLHIDVQFLAISSARGVVRITGDLKRNTADAAPIRATMLEDYERELKRVKNVRRIHLNPDNWRKGPSGSWVPVDPPGGSSRRKRRSNRAVRHNYEPATTIDSSVEAVGLGALVASLKKKIRSVPPRSDMG